MLIGLVFLTLDVVLLYRSVDEIESSAGTVVRDPIRERAVPCPFVSAAFNEQVRATIPISR